MAGHGGVRRGPSRGDHTRQEASCSLLSARRYPWLHGDAALHAERRDRPTANRSEAC